MADAVVGRSDTRHSVTKVTLVLAAACRSVESLCGCNRTEGCGGMCAGAAHPESVASMCPESVTCRRHTPVRAVRRPCAQESDVRAPRSVTS
eukprot:363429-Chlamydomonas_euryale.AAC.35